MSLAAGRPLHPLRRRIRLFLTALLLSRAASAARAQAIQGATVSGVVYDSVAMGPLAGAAVQLVATDNLGRFTRGVLSDVEGRFTIPGVPDGRYGIGFVHPLLDSLGVEPIIREVRIDGGQALVANLAVPSPARLQASICGAVRAKSGFALGTVRDSRGREALPGATVTVEWVEVSFTKNGVFRRIQRDSTTTRANGWFAVCGIPRSGTVALRAGRGGATTDLVEMQMPYNAMLRRDLLVGPAERSGPLRLSGKIVAVSDNLPLGGVTIGIANGTQTRTNSRGEWSLADVPPGTRVVDVRAFGYWAEHVPIDVTGDTPPVVIALSTVGAVLDTVRVSASRATKAFETSGFAERRQSGIGRYLTGDEVARRNPLVTSQLFRAVPGMVVDRNELGVTSVLMRGIYSDRCAPAVYIDGHPMNSLSGDEIDDFVHPDEIAGLEIYTGTASPPQFSTGMAGMVPATRDADVSPCGSIVIWTKLRPGAGSALSFRQRLMASAGIALVAAGLVALMRR